MAKVLVQFTKNYDMFVLKEDNRDVKDERHIKDLMGSMERNGFLQSKAISVKNRGNKYEVLDGQHRLEAAKRLGITVWYNVDDNIPETALPDLQIAKKWLPKDYLKHFVVNEVKNYMRLEELHNKYPKASITTIVLLLEGTSKTAGSRKRFEEGSIKIKSLEKATKVLELVMELYKTYKHEWLWGRTFLTTYMEILEDIEGYSHKILLDRLQSRSEEFRQMLSVEGYYKMIGDIYNHKARTNKLKFIRKPKDDKDR